MLPSPRLIRAAREILNIRQDDLAAMTGLCRRTISTVEKGTVPVSNETMKAIVAAFEAEGISFQRGRIEFTGEEEKSPAA